MPGRREELFDRDLLVRLERLHLIAKRIAFRGHGGQRRSRGIGDGLEFADHRDYSPGDDLRFIDWNYYARMEKLLLRLFHTHSEAPVGLLIDVSASMAAPDEGKLMYALRTAAALVYVAMGGLERVTVVPFSDRLHTPLTTGRNRSEITRVLEFLSALTAHGQTDLLRCAEQFARGYSSVGTLLVVSDLCDSESVLETALGRLAPLRRDVSVVHVFEPTPDVPSGPVVLRDAEKGREITAEITPESLRSAVERHARWCRGCQRACAARGAAYVPAPTDLPFERLVLDSLRRAGVVAG